MAYRTLFVLRAFHADRGLFVDYPTAGGVTFGGNGFGFGLAARRAFSCLSAAFSAGCSFCGAPASEIVTRRLDNGLCLYHFAANRAVRTLGLTVGGAGRWHGFVDNFGVTISLDRFRLCIAAFQASIGLNTLCRAGRLFSNFSIVILVTRRLDDRLRLYHFAANRAVRAFGFAIGGAGGGDCLIYNFGVTFGRDNFCIGVAAVAGKCFFPSSVQVGCLDISSMYEWVWVRT